jgi:hypothetical protein
MDLKHMQDNDTYTAEKKYNYVYNQVRVNGEYYIGIHSTDNMDDNYNGSGTVFKRKYKGDPDSFTKTILCYRDTRDQVASIEGFLVTEETIKEPLCLNDVPGGDRGFSGSKHNAETKAKMSASQKGKNHPNYDPTVRTIEKPDATGDETKKFTGTRQEMLAEFPEMNGSGLSQLLLGNIQTHKGWRLPGTALNPPATISAETLEKLSGKNNGRYDHTVRTIENPHATGDETKEFTGTRQEMLAEFPELTPAGLSQLLLGNIQTHKGWKLK